jgi:hypothetical protein
MFAGTWKRALAGPETAKDSTTVVAGGMNAGAVSTKLRLEATPERKTILALRRLLGPTLLDTVNVTSPAGNGVAPPGLTTIAGAVSKA